MKLNVNKVQPVVLEVGDFIILKGKHGAGEIKDVLTEPDPAKFKGYGTYPMYQIRDNVTSALKWCTHLVIKEIHHVRFQPHH